MAKPLDRVVRRLVREVGLPRTVSTRIAKKLNALAKSVEWANPLPDTNGVGPPTAHKRARKVARAGRRR